MADVLHFGGSKDGWDKLDVLGRLVSGVVLAVIAFILKTGADDIAAAQQRGELVRSLITDLTTRDQAARQDIALIALDHSIGERTPQLVVEIAERLASDTTGYAGADRARGQALHSIAYRILRRRDPARADAVRSLLESRFTDLASDPALRAALRSAPEAGSETTVAVVGSAGAGTTLAAPVTAPPRDSAARAATDLLAPLASNIVYLQFQGAVRRATMDSLRRELVAAGFTAPGVERIEREFTSAVRFFHASDAALADSVARMVQARLAARGVRLPALPVQDLTRRRMPVPRRQIEVWVSP